MKMHLLPDRLSREDAYRPHVYIFYDHIILLSNKGHSNHQHLCGGNLEDTLWRDTDSNSSLAVVFVENNEKQKWQQCYFYDDVVMALKGSAFSSAFHS